MSCASCAGSVQNIISSEKGVRTARVNFSYNSIFVEYDNNLKGSREMDERLLVAGYSLLLSEFLYGREREEGGYRGLNFFEETLLHPDRENYPAKSFPGLYIQHNRNTFGSGSFLPSCGIPAQSHDCRSCNGV
jgi:copper chaperone CopZ